MLPIIITRRPLLLLRRTTAARHVNISALNRTKGRTGTKIFEAQEEIEEEEDGADLFMSQEQRAAKLSASGPIPVKKGPRKDKIGEKQRKFAGLYEYVTARLTGKDKGPTQLRTRMIIEMFQLVSSKEEFTNTLNLLPLLNDQINRTRPSSILGNPSPSPKQNRDSSSPVPFSKEWQTQSLLPSVMSAALRVDASEQLVREVFSDFGTHGLPLDLPNAQLLAGVVAKKGGFDQLALLITILPTYSLPSPQNDLVLGVLTMHHAFIAAFDILSKGIPRDLLRSLLITLDIKPKDNPGVLEEHSALLRFASSPSFSPGKLDRAINKYILLSPSLDKPNKKAVTNALKHAQQLTLYSTSIWDQGLRNALQQHVDSPNQNEEMPWIKWCVKKIGRTLLLLNHIPPKSSTPLANFLIRSGSFESGPLRKKMPMRSWEIKLVGTQNGVAEARV